MLVFLEEDVVQEAVWLSQVAYVVLLFTTRTDD